MTTSKGLVFDIKRFAVHDGQGIRTTIFLKGCPLCCVWCQNPEGILPVRQVLYFSSRCIHCKLCQKYGKDHIIYQNRPILKKRTGHFDDIIYHCPSTALQYDSQYYTVDELFEEIKKDIVFFKHGGGVTISGGEPFMQSDFLKDILKKCHYYGIHTAIETSLYVNTQTLFDIIDDIDELFIDLKIFDNQLHKKYTNVDNQLIKDNIQYLLTHEKYRDRITIRTPLIPDITATTQNIQDISHFLVSLYPSVKYELLNYNTLAPSKYELLDQDYFTQQALSSFSKEEMNMFYDILKEQGIIHIIR